MRELKPRNQENIKPVRLVFDDKSGRRRWFFDVSLLVVVILFILVFGEFFYRITNYSRPTGSSLPIGMEIAVGQDPYPKLTVLELDTGRLPRCEDNAWLKDRPSSGLSAFVPAGDRAAISALALHCGKLDDVYFAGHVLTEDGVNAAASAGADPFSFPIESFRDSNRFADRPRLWSVISLQSGAAFEELLDHIKKNGLFSGSQLDAAQRAGVAGICFDLSTLVDPPVWGALALVSQLRSTVLERGFQTCLIGAADTSFLGDSEVVAQSDRIVAVLRQASPSPAHAPAPIIWSETQIARLKADIPTDKLRIALATRATVWKSGWITSETLTYPEAMLSAYKQSASQAFGASENALKLYLVDETGRPTHFWVPDAATLIRTLDAIGEPRGAILWPIGGEDPSFWEAEYNLSDLPQEVDLSHFVAVVGEGPFPVLASDSQLGSRKTILSPDGKLEDVIYEAFPAPSQIDLIGQTDRATAAITFDGVGTPESLDSILASLSARSVEATFFLDVADVLFREDQIERIVAQGHSIALQTRIRPHLSHTKSVFLRARSKLTQHALAHHLGIVALIVREPGVAGENIKSIAELDQLRKSQSAGLLPIRIGLTAPSDPKDIGPFIDLVQQRILTEVTQIIRFDLSEGSSSSAAIVLGEVLAAIENDGITIRSLPGIAGTVRDLLQPPVISALRKSDDLVYAFLRISWRGVESFVTLLALVVALRGPAFLGMALFWRNRFRSGPAFEPAVTVIVPAYNEATVIERTIRSILASRYPSLSVLVVDDGSTDDTVDILRSAFLDDNRVALIRQSNRGKWYAENAAIDVIETDFFVVVDADTLLDPNALGHLMRPFADERVGAVAGTVEVGNPVNFIALCQKLEYLISQSVMRRAYEVFDGILVVPGAIGAWRVEAVRKAGLVSGDTITEDADLTVAVHRAGYKVAFQPEAVSYTEVPETASAFLKQRLRWSLGMLQVSRKHARSIIEGRSVGIISIIDALWFRVTSSVVFPIVDGFLVLLVVDGVIHLWLGDTAAVLEISPFFVGSLLLIVLADASLVVAAFWFDGKGDWRLVPLVPLLRFGYRQLLYISSFRSILHAIKGQMRGWQKLARTGDAKLPETNFQNRS